MADETPTPRQPSLREQIKQANLALELAEARYTTRLFEQLTQAESRIAQQFQEGNYVGDPDDRGWAAISGSDTDQKSLGELRDPMVLRRQMYRFWRLQPHARGILRNFVRFVVGPGFALDYDDDTRGDWTDAKKTKLKVTNKDDDTPLVALVWEEFETRNHFKRRMKEIVLRTFRDGECFVRRFVRKGRVTLRFIEPERVGSAESQGTVQRGDLDDPGEENLTGKPTVIKDGIEYLETDIETVVAYHVTSADERKRGESERVPAKDVIHIKAVADSNDLRGIPILEVVAKRIMNYDQWEEYRMILNKVRTAVALVRKVSGTSTQAEQIIRARQSPRESPRGMEPQTTSGRREAMFKAGTILTPSPGVEYSFISPNLDARDASEDGRRILLSIASGVGLPEMLVTGDWSNSNFSSSVEARTPAVREWEDWQEFFQPHVQLIYRWVIDAATEIGLPDETSRDTSVQWPPIISKDANKETERLEKLAGNGVLSKHTWTAMENLDYDTEQQNIDGERDEAMETMKEMQAAGGDPAQLAALLGGARKPGQPGQPPGADGQQPGKDDDEEDEEEDKEGRVRPRRGAKTQAEARTAFQVNLRALQEEIAAIEDPIEKAAMERYLASTNRALILWPLPTHANGTPPPPRRRTSLARR